VLDIVRRARHQGIRYDERSTSPYQAAVIARAAEVVGADGSSSVQRWSSNFNADFYRMRTPSDDLMLKIMVSKPAAVLDVEFDALRSLAAIASESKRFRIPQPRVRLAELSAYVTEYREGRLLTDLFLAGPREPGAIVDASRRCGEVLADIHHAWQVPEAPFDAAGVVDDLTTHAGWRFTAAEESVLEAVVARTDGLSVPNARLYLDFDPVNVLVGPDSMPCLLDPPEAVLTGPVHWDVGVFLLGLRRAGWRRPWTVRRGRTIGVEAGRAFLDAYRSCNRTALAAAPDLLPVTLFELVRLAQLSVWWLAPTQFRQKLTGFARTAYGWPLIRRERRSIFDALARGVGHR
jgi:hypothetical protein